MNNTAEILNKQKKQNRLKKEVKQMKKKIPSFFIGFIFFVAISLYFIENLFKLFFEKNFNFIISFVILFCLLYVFFLILCYYKIKNKIKDYKALGKQLYHLMKLEVTKNE